VDESRKLQVGELSDWLDAEKVDVEELGYTPRGAFEIRPDVVEVLFDLLEVVFTEDKVVLSEQDVALTPEELLTTE
jgi:hypothetical protein